jgi:magnesium-protoporphyrin IX monomethyl ester (oxidative) cyclase
MKTKNYPQKTFANETLLTPRFYTTNFEEMGKVNISSNINEIKAILEEFKSDYNQKHFIRDNDFLNCSVNFDEKTKKLFIEFLERSCTAEFSGFLLYKELSRSLKNINPLLAEGFSFMARDEARHAGFLNKAMSDFDVSLDLGFLTKTRKYTFFSPKFIFYATYLSEKIGYWRYITIYRYLEKNPQFRIYPIFKFFESWCQDENRHGDFFAAILKSQPNLLETYESKLWCRFFLLSVFITMYLNDNQRSDFYSTIGLNSKQFDKHVILKTNQSCENLFPVILDVKNPDFFKILDECCLINQNLITIEKNFITIEKNLGNNILKFRYQFPYYKNLIFNFIKLYLLPPIVIPKYKKDFNFGGYYY